jgi:hypothetical protein
LITSTIPRFELLSGAAAAAALDAGGCFESTAWVRAVAAVRARPHRLVAVRARLADGRLAVLGGAEHRRVGIAVFESMPMSGYGGWLCDAGLSLDDERMLNRLWLAQAAWTVVVLTSRPGRSATLPQAADRAWWPRNWRERLAPRTFATHLLDLRGDDEELLHRVRRKMRSYLRRLNELGFEAALSHGKQDLERFHAWYVEGSRHWQRPADDLLPKAFFSALARRPEDPVDAQQPVADVWILRHQGLEVGAALFLVGRREVQYQASGTSRIDAVVSAMDALLWMALRHYRDRGLQTMNLGASEGLSSVARFKEKFGAQEATYAQHTYLMPRWFRSTEPAVARLVPGPGASA